jgi:hypothetical protein
MIINVMTVNAVDAKLTPRTLAGGQVESVGHGGCRLSVPEGQGGQYRLAQLDDYGLIPRSQFPWEPSLKVSLMARASHTEIPGTWGFGLWNDPFITDFGFAGGVRRLPVLPNTAWFFFASPENYLSLEDHLPAHGELAATFHSQRIAPIMLAAALPALPFFKLGATSRLLRRAGRRWIQQDAAPLNPPGAAQDSPVTAWRRYTIQWYRDKVVFEVEGRTVLRTHISPDSPLGLVIWIDNQYAAMPPDGGLAFGTLANPVTAWIEITDLTIIPSTDGDQEIQSSPRK